MGIRRAPELQRLEQMGENPERCTKIVETCAREDCAGQRISISLVVEPRCDSKRRRLEAAGRVEEGGFWLHITDRAVSSSFEKNCFVFESGSLGAMRRHARTLNPADSSVTNKAVLDNKFE
jgi:hypothetical protein